MVRPAGSPVAANDIGSPSGSRAAAASVTSTPSAHMLAARGVSSGGRFVLRTVNRKLVEVEAPLPSSTVTTIE